MNNWLRAFFVCVVFLSALLCAPQSVLAAGFGVHILEPEELPQVVSFFGEQRPESEPLYVTVPFPLTAAAPEARARWQAFFDEAKKSNVVPLVRLTTKFDTEKNAWLVPTRRDILTFSCALDELDWPQADKHVIFFNEPNHAAEWGGEVDPENFADVSAFAFDWFATEQKNYVLLPAAADLAAPNGKTTMEAFTFWRRALARRPEITDSISAWNSHSYPNPAFSAPPTLTAKNSLSGYQHELTFLKAYTKRELPVYITETGWRATNKLEPKLAQYYQTAMRGAWSDQRLIAVTPFLFRGSPGPFAEFSLVVDNNISTKQGQAYKKSLEAFWRTLLSSRLSAEQVVQ